MANFFVYFFGDFAVGILLPWMTASPAFVESPLMIPFASLRLPLALGLANPSMEVGLVLPLTSMFRCTGFIVHLCAVRCELIRQDD
jgi:hypothetical protein